MKRLCLALALTIAFIGSACSDSPVNTPADAAPTDSLFTLDAAPDMAITGPSRSYQLASTGAQLLIQGMPNGLQLTAANLATDVDVLSYHEDFYGVPWDEFEAGKAPPAEWAQTMQAQAAQAQMIGKDVFLSLQLVSGTHREYLADKAVVQNGALTKVQNWSVQCYDFATAVDGASKRAAYLNYVDFMVRLFRPRYVNVAIEMNLFMPCGPAWKGLVDTERAAYAAAKAALPSVIAFPSIQVDSLYGYNDCPQGMTRDQCYEANYARLADLERDRFAISTYPYLIDGIKRVGDLPADWITRAADRGHERALIAETGWISDNVVGQWVMNGAPQCITAIGQTINDELAWFQFVLAAATKSNVDLVTWWSNRDLIPANVMTSCPCSVDPAWCSVVQQFRASAGNDPMAQFYGEAALKIFGTMGIRDYAGAPKQPLFDAFQKARELPARPIY